jgi:hypothetical protein
MIFGAAIAGLSVIVLAIVSLLLESLVSPPAKADEVSHPEIPSQSEFLTTGSQR